MLRIGVDIGGTFTDFVIFNSEDGRLQSFKVLTNNTDPSETVTRILRPFGVDNLIQVIHGSTVATNALLERKGSRCALITTRGFKDVLEIGRQNRPDLYNLNVSRKPPLIPSDLRFELTERVDADGNVLLPLDIHELDTLINRINSENISSIAVCLLFSFLYPDHEKTISHILHQLGFFVSTSSEILPEYREYERTSTTVVNAYVSPILDDYLSELETSLPKTNLQVMQSNGGMINVSDARKNGVRCILSGPAGGIVGAQYIVTSSQSDRDSSEAHAPVKIITFDMGGTSTDVSLINGEPSITTESVIGGCPIHIPVLDIHTIGAGGGSIASIDPGGSLRVGPQSAGADPGPACYGKGEFPTVSDANLVLGRLIPDYFLGGSMPIYPERAQRSIEILAQQLGLTPLHTALGIIDVVNIQMEHALRVISVERGYDPRDYSLFSFGGAGGLHACELARHLGIHEVVITRYASTLSALGMLSSDVIKDYVQTVMISYDIDRDQLDKLFYPIFSQAILDISAQGISDDQIEIKRTLDVRYIGQSYELTVPFSNDYREAFLTAHLKAYGYANPEKAIEIVNIRVKATGKIPPIRLPKFPPTTSNSSPEPESQVNIYLKNKLEKIPLYLFDGLSPGTSFTGPALVVSPDTTILIDHADSIQIDNYRTMLIHINQ